MPLEEYIAENAISDFFVGNMAGVFIALGIFLAFLLLIAFYFYFALAWYTIAKKLNFKRAWLAWIPIANFAMILHIGKFHWAWIFLLLVPVIGWIALIVIGIIAHWRIFETCKYPGWFSLSIVIPQIGGILYLIAIGFIAWADRKKRL